MDANNEVRKILESHESLRAERDALKTELVGARKALEAIHERSYAWGGQTEESVRIGLKRIWELSRMYL